MAQARFLGPPGHSLFAWHHSARTDTRRDAAIVLCPPLGFEYICVYRAWRLLAERLAVLGFDVFRFDYHGTGNSAGDAEDPDRLDAWLLSIERVVADARAMARTGEVTLVGFRLGATLALQTAAMLGDVSRLVLWSPFHSGQAYLRELKAFARLSRRDTVPVVPDGGDIEAAGFVTTKATEDALAGIDLLSMAKAPAAQVLLIDRDDRPADTRLSEKLSVLGCDVTRVRPDGTAEALVQPMLAEVPDRVLEEIVGWLDGWRPAGSAPVATPAGPRSAGLAVTWGAGYRERAVRFGAGDRLFGVVTEPSDDSEPETAIVFLNTGCEYHVGPHRLYVPLARHWASRGHLVLRFDLGGIGDSRAPAGASENLPYPDHALDDVRAAVALVHRGMPTRRVVLVGLCSGAWHAFRAAREGVGVDAIFSVNSPLYLREGPEWAQRLAGHHELQRYGRSLRDPAKWAKALRGQAGYGTFVRLTTSALARAVRRHVQVTLASRSLPGLAGDVQHIAARGIQTLFVFAHGEEGLEYFQQHAGPALRRRATRACIREVKIEGAGHMFQPLEAQRALRGLLLDFVDRVGTCRATEAESMAATRRVERRPRPSWADGA